MPASRSLCARAYRPNRAELALNTCLTACRADADVTVAGAARGAADEAADDGPRDRRPAGDRPAHGAALHHGVAGPRHPGRGAARGRRRLPRPPRFPAPAADALRRRGGRRRPRPDRRPPAGARHRVGARRRRAREDPSRPPRPPAPARAGARDGARLHGDAEGGRPGCGGHGPPARRCGATRPARAHGVSVVLRRADPTRAEPLRPGRPRGSLVPGRPRPPPR